MPILTATQIRKNAEQAVKRLADCNFCPRGCRVNRLAGELGYCRIGREALVSSYGPHFGEERLLVGRGGSGTVFFAGCNLLCVFCQNEDISHGLAGHAVSDVAMSEMFFSIQEYGCHNLNLVTPSHVVPQILSALAYAMENGFRLPVVYNTGGYDRLDTLRLLEGVVDIYMPDLKFMDVEVSEKMAQAPDYPAVAQAAIKEMHRQVGDLALDARGIARRGLLVRHLVMPNDLAGTQAAMGFLAAEVSRETYVNIMGQYRPCHEAFSYPEISRRPTRDEMERAFEAARQAGLTRLD